jgi:hypothetical protein
MRNPTTIALLLAATALSASVSLGCNQGKKVTMADAFDLDIFGPHEDDLHSPYVAGATFDITAESHTGNPDQSGWTLTSSDPTVLAVSNPTAAAGTEFAAHMTAGAAGTTTLTLKDASGNTLDQDTVSVGVPDRVAFYAQGLLLTGSEANAEVTTASVVAGGEATFLLRYYQGSQELNGNNALLDPTGQGPVTASKAQSSFAVARDFVQITAAPAVTGGTAAGTVALVAGSTTLASLPVTAVDPNVVTNVTVDKQDDGNASKGDQLFLYAHAVDQSSADVYGVSFDWLINNQTTSAATFGGPTDLFAYQYDSSVSETVVAAYEGFAPSSVVHGHGGTVESTANVGCTVARAPGLGAAGTAGGVLFGLLALGGLAARRRRALG